MLFRSACGNFATASQTILVGDNEAPIFANVPANATINCDRPVPTVINPSISDVCDASPRLTFLETRQNGACATSYKLIRTWTTTDVCGNSRTASQVVSVGDTEKPELIGVPADLAVSCGRNLAVANVTARDNCDPDVGITFNERMQRGACGDNFTLFRTWTAIDACGNISSKMQMISVKDDVNPVLINVPQDVTVNIASGETVLAVPTITAIDNCSNDVAVTFNEQKINATCGYTLVRSWIATDNCSNRDALTQTITVVESITVDIASTTPENCGQRNGRVTFTPLTLDFRWADGSSSGSRNDLAAGTYNVTVSNAVGCVKIVPVMITNECGCVAPVAQIETTDISCTATGDGTATVTVTNGQLSDFKFIWTSNVSATNTARNLTAGVYTVRVERVGKSDCFIELPFQIIEPNRISVSEPIITKASCTSPTGKVEFRLDAGSENWAYRWSDGFTGRVRENLNQGTYIVTISKPNSRTDCQVEKTVVVGSDNALRTTFAINKQPVCGQPNGDVTLTTTGGSGQYIYSWGEGNRRFVLTAGQHTVTTTDVVTGCQTTVTFVLNNLSVDATIVMDTVTAVTCNSMSDGRINYRLTAFGSNFVQPATVDIRDTQGRLYANGSLAAGSYLLTVKDAPGCIAIQRTFTVTQPTVMTTNFVKTNQTCDSLGTISLNVSGGNGGYKFNWSDLQNQVNQPKNRDNLAAAYYSVIITDAAGCTANVKNIQVKDSCVCRQPIIDSVAAIAARCGINNGTATILLRGGNENKYSYSWSPSIGTPNSVGNSRSGLTSGFYSVFIRLRTNPTCFASVNVALGNVEGPKNTTYTTTPATCELSNGSVTLRSNDFVDYIWVFDNSTAATRSDLAAGYYQVQVTKRDAPECPSVINVKVEKSNSLTATATVSRKATCGQPNGVATINVTGGSGNYSYSWGNTATRNELWASIYSVTIVDNNAGCKATTTFALENEATGSSIITIAEPIVYVNCNGDKNGRVNYAITSSTGYTQPPTVSITNAQGRLLENGSLPVGSYCIVVRDVNGCLTASQCFEVREPVKLQASATKINKTCSVGGSINVSATGGSGSYIATWSDLTGFNQPLTRNNLNAGTYRVTISDVKGCSAIIDTINIKDECVTPTCLLSASYEAQNRSCTEGGKITVRAVGGTQPYTFDWFDLAGANNGQNRFDLAVGSYSVIITDAANCKDTLKNIIIKNLCADTTGGYVCTPPTLANSTVNPTHCGLAVGSISLNVIGNVVYKWSLNVSNSNVASGLNVGSYHVKIANASDTTCYIEKDFIIQNQNGVAIGEPSITPATCGASNGKVIFPNTGHVLSYVWSDGGNGSARSDLAKGRYVVTVTDPTGTVCEQITTVEVGGTSTLTANFIVEKRATCGQSNGQARITTNGGSGSYTYSWGSSATRSDLASGTLNVTVTDNTTGCTAIVVVNMTNETVGQATLAMPSTTVYVSCAGNHDGSIAYELSYSAGFSLPAHVEIRTTNAGLAKNDSLTAGRYILNVFDANNCLAVTQNFEVREPQPFAVSTTVLPVTCAARGSIALEVIGGSGVYRFNWSDLAGQTNQPQHRTNLVSGNYGVTITDSRGCNMVLNNLIVGKDSANCNICPRLATTTAANKTCTEGGKITVSTIDGSAPYTFDWLDLAGTNNPQNRTDLTESTYTVIVIDARSCRDTISNIRIINDCISTTCNIVATETPQNKSCTEGGKITLNVAGGSAPYTYNWADLTGSSNSQSRTALTKGTYSVTITDARNCILKIDNIIVGDDCPIPTCTLLANATTTPKTCEEGGTIAVNVNGGRTPYSYQWGDVAGVNNIQNRWSMAAGNYTVTVFDAQGCSVPIPTINVRNEATNCGTTCMLNVSATPTMKTCTEGGKIDVQITGGTAPYSCTWNDLIGSDHPEDRTNLTAGTYSVIVFDAAGCRDTINNIVVINDCATTTCTLVASVSPIAKTCTEGGKITITTTGGTAPFTYDWLDLAGTNDVQNRTDLATGNYTVIVKDNQGCRDTVKNIIIVNNCITISCTLNVDVLAAPKTCQNLGSIALTVNGGTIPYTYRWSDLTGTSQPRDRANLPSGTYQVTVSDGSGCDTILTNIIVKDEATNCGGTATCNLSVSVIPTARTCQTGGSIVVNATGGTTPLTFKWSDLSTTTQPQNHTDLAAGTYRLTVTDSRNCDTVIQNIIIRDDCPVTTCTLDANFATTNKTCTEGGKIIITTIGGTAPFTYDWLDLVGTGDVQNRTDLPVGTYAVIVTDSKGCTDTLKNITITNTCISNNCTLSASVSSSAKTCTEGGKMTVNVNGGTTPYTYRWSDLTGIAQVQNRTNLPSGTYRLTVSDAGGCDTIIQNIIVINEAVNCGSTTCSLTATVSAAPKTCNTLGSLAVNVAGGQTPYTYRWADLSGNTQPQSRTALAAGTYRLTVTDGRGCDTVFQNLVVNDEAVNCLTCRIVASASTTPKTCTSSGSINITVNSGTIPYTFKWSDLSGTIQPQNRIGLVAGTYSVTVTDKNGCDTILQNIIIKDKAVNCGNIPCAIVATATPKNTTCTEGGKIAIEVRGGIEPYRFDWLDMAGTDNPQNRTDLVSGSYTLVVTDGRNCKDTLRNIVIENDCHPTICTPPNIDNVVVMNNVCGTTNGSITIMTGPNMVFNWTPNVSSSNKATNLAAGIYYVRVASIDRATCFAEREIVVNNTDGPYVEPPVIRPARCSASNGLVRFANPNWQYVWSDGTIGFERSNLAAGHYSVIVSDPIAPNCSSIIMVIVESENSSISATTNITRKATCGGANGSATIAVTGGSGNYSYSWGVNAVRNDLKSGVYDVVVIDNVTGCRTIASVNMPEETTTSAAILIDNKVVYTKCVGESNGRVIFTVSPSNLPVLIKNSNGEVVVNGALAVGKYSIEVRSANGCVAAITGFEVKNPTSIDAVVSVMPKKCSANGSINVIAKGGTGTLTYRWNDGETLPSRTNVVPNTYWVTITDESGCSVVLSDIVVKDEAVNCGNGSTCRVVAVSTVKNANCTEGGKIEISATGGRTPYTYDWRDIAGADNLKTRTQLDSGRYTVIVRDSLGCSDTLRDIIVRNTCYPYDTCPTVYIGSRLLYVNDCSDKAAICTNLDFRAYERYQVLDNGHEIAFESEGCSQDTLFSYSYFSMLRFYPNGPWMLDAWKVNGRTYSASIENLAVLVDSMNRWDATGNWQLERQTNRLTGGDNRNNYGTMSWSRESRSIAKMDPNRYYVPNQLNVRLLVGTHILEFRDTINGCHDSVKVVVSCRPPTPIAHNSRIVRTIYVSQSDTICLSSNVLPFETVLTNTCSSNYQGFAGYVIDDRTDCINLLGVRAGRDSLCIRRCYANGVCDTTTIVIVVKAYPTPSDTSCVQITPNSVDLSTICGTTASFCTNLHGADTASYRIMLDGRPYKGGYGTCSNDTFISYTYFSLFMSNPYGPWTLESWRVDNKTFSGQIANIHALVDSMNRWDYGGHWVLEQTTFAIKGGVAGRDYGQMLWSKNGTRAAEFRPNFTYNNRSLSLNVETGRHVFIFMNLLRGCSDTIIANVTCRSNEVIQPIPAIYVDTTVLVGKTLDYCLTKTNRATSTETVVTTICPPKGKISASINDQTDCILLRGQSVGLDTICLLRCDPTGLCDTTIIRVKVVKPTQQTFKTVVQNVEVGTDSTYCVNRSLMVGTRLILKNVCEPNAVDNVNFIVNGLCINYFADEIGSDTACLVLCDEFGNCDTTRFIVNVKARSLRLFSPVAMPDKATLSYGSSTEIEVIKNDSTYNVATQVELVTQPKYGTVTVNPATGIVTYRTSLNDCEPRDSFIYAIINAVGSDTTTVSIEILCDDVVVFSGFSPNDDGKNDELKIIGLEKYPGSKLLVFNRWGNQVFDATDYKNDWKGTYDNKALPDGTYFWILDLGEGKTMSGYVQILR